jgi:hypothetical protein
VVHVTNTRVCHLVIFSVEQKDPYVNVMSLRLAFPFCQRIGYLKLRRTLPTALISNFALYEAYHREVLNGQIGCRAILQISKAFDQLGRLGVEMTDKSRIELHARLLPFITLMIACFITLLESLLDVLKSFFQECLRAFVPSMNGFMLAGALDMTSFLRPRG